MGERGRVKVIVGGLAFLACFGKWEDEDVGEGEGEGEGK